jgi:hypothetical protein
MVVALAHAYRAETSNYLEKRLLGTNFNNRHKDAERMSDDEALAYAARVIADPGAREHALPIRGLAEERPTHVAAAAVGFTTNNTPATWTD